MKNEPQMIFKMFDFFLFWVKFKVNSKRNESLRVCCRELCRAQQRRSVCMREGSQPPSPCPQPLVAVTYGLWGVVPQTNQKTAESLTGPSIRVPTQFGTLLSHQPGFKHWVLLPVLWDWARNLVVGFLFVKPGTNSCPRGFYSPSLSLFLPLSPICSKATNVVTWRFYFTGNAALLSL